MKRWAAFYTLGVFALAACGGGGGSNGTGGLGGFVPPTATPTPSTTTAQGTVVDDASNAPLSGVTVRLDPWAAYPTPGPTPTPILTTTTDANGHFTITAANGTYLLVIGRDVVYTPPPGYLTPAPAATDTPVPGTSDFQATIHDRIVLPGGGTATSPLPLVAPTMLAEPNYGPPASEMSGNYRLMMIDPRTDVPCYLGYNLLRAHYAHQAVVLDEWSSENGRAVATSGMNPLSSNLAFITTGDGLVSGGANCSNTLADFFAAGSAKLLWVASPVNLWFGGTYIPYTAQHAGVGGYVFPNDPRVFSDPNNLIWP